MAKKFIRCVIFDMDNTILELNVNWKEFANEINWEFFGGKYTHFTPHQLFVANFKQLMKKLLFDQERYEEARKAFHTQLRIDKNMKIIEDTARINIADTYYAEEKIGPGIGILTNFKELRFSPDAQWKLGEGYLLLGKSSKALILMTGLCVPKASLLLNEFADWKEHMKIGENTEENQGYSTNMLLSSGQIEEEDLEILER